jgi:hypothetical protein
MPYRVSIDEVAIPPVVYGPSEVGPYTPLLPDIPGL